MQPAIVVAAHNRSHTLKRLLKALEQANIPQNTTLIISIDPGGANQSEVVTLSEKFSWSYGQKQVVVHPQHLGLVDHILSCGDFALEYGAIIRLEDDHVPGRQFYTFAQQALAFFADDPQIAGLSLYALWFNGFTHTPFIPLLDGSDVYFMQNPWSHGQAYTAAQWSAFRTWLAEANTTITPEDGLHEVYRQFPPTDWFPTATKYLVTQNKYVVFPRESHTTHFGDIGTHFAQPTRFYQVPLQQHKTDYHFMPLTDSFAVYDSFQELNEATLKRLVPEFAELSLTIDLNATKSRQNMLTDYVLTTRPTQKALKTFGKVLLPLVANPIEGIHGQGISLARREDVHYEKWLQSATHSDNEHHYQRYYQSSRKKRLMRWIAQRAGYLHR